MNWAAKKALEITTGTGGAGGALGLIEVFDTMHVRFLIDVDYHLHIAEAAQKFNPAALAHKDGQRPQLPKIPWDVLKPEIQWVTKDADGSWLGHEVKPYKSYGLWACHTKSLHLEAIRIPETPHLDWKDSLMERPRK